MKYISLDAKHNWALKFGNLRILKKILDKYLEEELNMPNLRFDQVYLLSISRQCDPGEIMKLFERIFFAVATCPQKRIFMEKIMELDESVQTTLMVFMQKITEENENKNIPNSALIKKEIEMLKNETKTVSKQAFELAKELNSTIEEKNRIQISKQQLEATIKRLYKNVDRKSIQEKGIHTPAMDESKYQIIEEDKTVSENPVWFDKIKNQYETEIIRLKNELNIAATENINTEKMIQDYREKLESISVIKRKAADLQKQNEALITTISSQDTEIKMLVMSNRQLLLLKEKILEERNRADILFLNLENQEKKFKKLENDMIWYTQKIHMLEAENEELKLERQDSSNLSEESFIMEDEEVDVHILS